MLAESCRSAVVGHTAALTTGDPLLHAPEGFFLASQTPVEISSCQPGPTFLTPPPPLLAPPPFYSSEMAFSEMFFLWSASSDARELKVKLKRKKWKNVLELITEERILLLSGADISQSSASI